MKVEFYNEIESDIELKFVVIASIYKDKWLYVKHRERNTYELAGGHIEAGEEPVEAAKRELYEETGAISFSIDKIGYYSVNRYGNYSYGVLYFSEIEELDKLPKFEMEEIILVDELLDYDKVTYPLIYPTLYNGIKNYRKE